MALYISRAMTWLEGGATMRAAEAMKYCLDNGFSCACVDLGEYFIVETTAPVPQDVNTVLLEKGNMVSVYAKLGMTPIQIENVPDDYRLWVRDMVDAKAPGLAQATLRIGGQDIPPGLA